MAPDSIVVFAVAEHEGRVSAFSRKSATTASGMTATAIVFRVQPKISPPNYLNPGSARLKAGSKFASVSSFASEPSVDWPTVPAAEFGTARAPLSQESNQQRVRGSSRASCDHPEPNAQEAGTARQDAVVGPSTPRPIPFLPPTTTRLPVRSNDGARGRACSNAELLMIGAFRRMGELPRSISNWPTRKVSEDQRLTPSRRARCLFMIWSLFVGLVDNVLKPILLGRGAGVPHW